jgi:hypothetical protein
MDAQLEKVKMGAMMVFFILSSLMNYRELV